MKKKRVNTAAKGARIEREAKHLLEAVGYEVTRAAASKGKWDLVAVGPLGVRLIQVKTNAPPSAIELENLQRFRPPRGSSVELWTRYDGEKNYVIQVISRG